MLASSMGYPRYPTTAAKSDILALQTIGRGLRQKQAFLYQILCPDKQAEQKDDRFHCP